MLNLSWTHRWFVTLSLAGALGNAWAADPVRVPVVTAGPKSVATGVEIDGVVEPIKQSLVSSQASGRVSALVVKAGDYVKAGQLLATVDDRETQTGVQRSQAQWVQSDSELRNAQLNVSRTRDLQAKGFVSQAPNCSSKPPKLGVTKPVRGHVSLPCRKSSPVSPRLTTAMCWTPWCKRVIWPCLASRC